MKLLIRAAGIAAAVSMVAFVGGCTVRPLMATGSAVQEQVALSSISVAPVSTRPAQEVRNHLIFLFSGGAGQPANPRYTLGLTATSSTSSAAQVQRAGENEPTAGLVTMTGTYSLTDATTGAVVANGKRAVSAAFDRPRQEFATLRAERDAQDRAARELAEFIQLSVAQDLARLGAR